MKAAPAAPAASETPTAPAEAVTPPYTIDFKAGNAGWTIIDANDDGTTWKFEDGAGMKAAWNSTEDMNDWLISPPVKLEGGKMYDISAFMYAQSRTFPERFELMAGSQPTPEAMTTTVIAPMEINWVALDGVDQKGVFVPQTTGNYYFGIHGISDRNQFALWVNKFAVSAPKTAEIPAPVADLTVTPGEYGALTATVKFTTPNMSIVGNPITSLTSAVIMRDGATVKTFTNPAVGAQLTYEDNLPKGGNVTYTVVCSNSIGTGLEASATAFIGVDTPAAPAWASVVETATPGEVLITWEAVTTDINGTPLLPGQVTYEVATYNAGWVTFSGELSGTSFTYQAVDAGQQRFVQYAVFAKTANGYGGGAATSLIPVGTPYTSFELSNEDDLSKYIVSINSAGGGVWAACNDYTLDDMASADYDNWYLGMKATYLNQFGSLFTGYISFKGKVNPGLTFYVYNIEDEDNADENTIATGVKVKDETEWTIVNTTVMKDGAPGWFKVTVDLSAYAGKVVQLQWLGIAKTFAYTFMDGIKVVSLHHDDLAAESISAPAKANTGAEYNVNVIVANAGANNASAYSVELYANDKLVDTRSESALATGARKTFTFGQTMSPVATSPVVYYAKVIYANDQDASNNRTASATVVPVISSLPTVANLTADTQDNTVVLTWDEPDLDNAVPTAVTEDFENGGTFAAEHGSWTFVDVDASPVGGFQESNLPGINPSYTKGSFWVWDNDALEFGDAADSFAAYSGSHFLFSLYRADDQDADDWAISPRLNGEAQTISFYAKSYSASFLEQIEVYYSTGTIALDDFVVIKNTTTVPNEWTKYEINLPAGALYFAIRSCAKGAFMLMIDDITYIPGIDASSLSLQGYDIYRDGVKINDSIVEEGTFVDTTAEAGATYTYIVVAVYDLGTSAPSASATVTLTGTGLGSVGAEEAPVEYFNLQGIRVENPSNGVFIRRRGSTATKIVR